MAKKQHGGKRPNSGRPVSAGGPSVVIAASVPESLAQALDDYAAQKQWNRSQAVQEAIRKLVKTKPAT